MDEQVIRPIYNPVSVQFQVTTLVFLHSKRGRVCGFFWTEDKQHSLYIFPGSVLFRRSYKFQYHPRFVDTLRTICAIPKYSVFS